MKRARVPFRVPGPRAGLAWSIAAWALFAMWAGARPSWGQIAPEEEKRLSILSRPEDIKKRVEKDQAQIPYEFYRTQVAPFDVLPFVKPRHWTTLRLEVQANLADFDGLWRTTPAPLPELPVEIVFQRDARLLKEQRRMLAQQVMLSKLPIPKEWPLELVRPGALRAENSTQALLTALPPRQMLVLVLSKGATDQFATWKRMAAVIPASVERDDMIALDRQRYYQLVLPLDPNKLPLSPHPLTWTTISHVVWDRMPPDLLSVAQQEALLDWLHWGGQLTITGGAGQNIDLLRESFLGPYLPASATGQAVALTADDLLTLSRAYPPPIVPNVPGPDSPEDWSTVAADAGATYMKPAPIQPPTGKPVQLAVLKPREGSAIVPLGGKSAHALAVERRVGRGRITMLAINPVEPALSAWPGMDTFVRRVVLRRPEEPIAGVANGLIARGQLEAHDLTWYRIAARDIQSSADERKNRLTASAYNAGAITSFPPRRGYTSESFNPEDASGDELDPRLAAAGQSVADWRDAATLPARARELLEAASGISVPSSRFVLTMILAYLLAVAPLNWAVCRFGLNRREWAWAFVPVISLGFAVGVQRFASFDMGFDAASDEIDLLELQADYQRAHLSRFASLYSTSRGAYDITYPDNATALALPFDTGHSIRGEDVITSIWRSSPVPGLLGLMVQPRSLALFRAEEMTTLAGSVRVERQDGHRVLINGSELELRDVTLVEVPSAGAHGGEPEGEPVERSLGTIAAGATVAIDDAPATTAASDDTAGPSANGLAPAAPAARSSEGPDPKPILRVLRASWDGRAENAGELRLVAWTPGPRPGQSIDPPIDRRRGFTAVLVHLSEGPPPRPDTQRYFHNQTVTAPNRPARRGRTRSMPGPGRILAPPPGAAAPQTRSTAMGPPSTAGPGPSENKSRNN